MKKLWVKVKDICNKVANWFKGVTTKIDESVMKYAGIGVDIVQGVKKFNESDAADAVEYIATLLTSKYGKALSALIPNIRSFLRRWLPTVIETLNVAEAVARVTTLEDKLKVLSNQIDKMDLDSKSGTYQEFAARLSEIAKDGRVTFTELTDFIKAVREVYNTNSNKITE